VLNTKSWPGQSKLAILQSLLLSYMKNFSTLKHLSTIPTTLLKLIFLPLHISPVVPLLVHVPCHTPTIPMVDTQAGAQPTHIIIGFLTLPHSQKPYLGFCQICRIQGHTAKYCPLQIHTNNNTSELLNSP